ncbi:Pimeloyl-ACP methyl ester carboxylesterase [Geodermatophilus dictyosporus]|uniref:Pimeloyl-ACP methyl ester carboxylesterase n=1 Tax=Geodermatophilus dictyosporus TaxID=1523247 RepID=A0A1I5RM61_9ACTN|nr:alpha/beta hydrolase [Geodermatophilus dictyosporus]SFP59625.1 Pimeloyl-ACP methyl ester carboxylesterase [Geodermatophilus dictyosporus]
MSSDPLVIGSGPCRVLALHGWFGSARGWGPFADLVDGDRYTYAFLDHRGYGARRAETGEYTIAEMAADALAAADALGWSSFAVLGHSMGGSVMQRVALDAGDRVTGLVGISPVPATGVPFDEQSWELFSGAAEKPENRSAIIDLTTGGRLSRTWLDRMVRASLESSDPVAFRAYLDAWGRTDFADEVRGRQVPVRLVVGVHDPALSAAVMEQTFLQLYPDVSLEVLANAGHYAMFETPVALLTCVERFLDQL